MAKQTEGIVIEFEGRTIKFDKSVDGMNKAIKTLKKEIKIYNNELKSTDDSAKSVDVVKKKIENLKTQQELLNGILQKYLDKLESTKLSAKEMNALEEKIVSIKKELSNTKVQIDNAYKSLEKFGNFDLSKLTSKIEQSGNRLKEFGEALDPIANTASKLIKATTSDAIEFEKAFAQVIRTVGEVDDTEIQRLEQGIREMAQEIPASTEEIANVVALMAQLGVSNDKLLEFTRVMIDLGNTTNLSAERAGEAIATFYNIVGSDYDTVDQFASTLLKLGVVSVSTEKDIVDMAERIASASHLIGLNEQEILGLASALSSLGLSAEAGGSAISTILARIDKDVALGAESLSIWAKLAGTSIKQFKDDWGNNAVEALERVLKGMYNLDESGENLLILLDQLEITNIRQTDALRRLASGEDNLTKYIDVANEAWEQNIALGEATNTIYETTDSKIKILQQKIKELALRLGESLLPIVNKLIELGEKIFDVLKNVDKETLQTTMILSGMVVVFTKLVKGIGNAQIAFARILKALVKINPTTIAVSAAISALIGLFTKINLVSQEFHANIEKARENLTNSRQVVDDYTNSMNELGNSFRGSIIDVQAEDIYLKSLVETLKTCYDENGKLIESKKKDAELIMGELKEAGVVEQSMLDTTTWLTQNETEKIYENIEAKKKSMMSEAYLNYAQEMFNANVRIKESIDTLSDDWVKYGELQELVFKDGDELISSYAKSFNADFEGIKKLVDDGTLSYQDLYNSIIELGGTFSSVGEEGTTFLRANQGISQEMQGLIDIYNQTNQKANDYIDMAGKAEEKTEEVKEQYELTAEDIKNHVIEIRADNSQALTSIDEVEKRLADLGLTSSDIQISANGALRNTNANGAMQSGGFGNSITLNASFVANGNLDETQALRFADLISERINEKLGGEI